MGQDAEFDLRVIGREQFPAELAGDERLADLAAVLGANRDVLQVRVARTQAAGRGHDLIERRVNSAVLGMNECGQGVEICPFEFRQAALLDHQARQGVKRRDASKTSIAVLGSPPGVFDKTGSFNSSNKTWRSWIGEASENGLPARRGFRPRSLPNVWRNPSTAS